MYALKIPISHRYLSTHKLPVHHNQSAMNDLNKKLFQSKIIKVKNYITFISHGDCSRVMYDEFQALERRTIYSKKPKAHEYEEKNRFKNIFPYNHNRVILATNKYCEFDYINASHIDGYKQTKHYIVTQDPLTTTVYDFWLMVFQYKCRTIVMLTQVSYKYYPDWNKIFKFNDILVTTIAQQDFKIYRRRLILVVKNGETLLVVHFHMLKWTNPNSLEKETDLVEFMRCVRQETDVKHPIIVSSSSGVGRTGVFIALDILFDQARKRQYVNIFKTVANLRKARSRFIISLEQYRMIYEVLDMYLLHTVNRKIR